jgi:hypothetical protein
MTVDELPIALREEAHRLIDAVPEHQLPGTVEMLRQWASLVPATVPRRRFRTTAIFDGEPDLGTRGETGFLPPGCIG